MNTGNKLFGAAILLLLGVVASCSRNIAVPVSPNLPTNTPVNTPTFTNTVTNTATNTPALTNTPSPTNSPTNTLTPTPTPTPTITNTPSGPTNTFTNTGTPTSTFTVTNTPTNTLSPTPTYTNTLTPTPTPNPMLIDDFESGGVTQNGIYPGPGPTTWNGSWFTSVNPGGTIYPAPMSWTKGTPGNGSTYAAHVTVLGASVTQYANFGFNFLNPKATWSMPGSITGVVFDAKLDAGSAAFNVQFPDADTDATGGICTSCSDYHGAKVCLTSSWQSVTVFFNQLSQQGWGVPQAAFKPASVYGMSFSFPVSTDMGLWIDNLKLTTAAPPAALGSNYISNFDFNAGGTSVNPNLTNYVPNANGFACNPPIWCGAASLLGPIVQCTGFSAPFGARVNGVYTDLANSCYPSMQLALNLLSTSGGVTTYYHLPTGLTGIQFQWRVPLNTTTGGTPSSYFLHYNNANIDGTSAFGQCTSGCWDDYVVSLPVAAAWGQQTVPFSTMARGGWGTPVPADPCSATNFPYSGGCYNNTTMGFTWASQSGNTAGTYTVDFQVDDVTFY